MSEEKPQRLRALIARYGQRLGKKMYDREQVAEELNLQERIEEIEEASENIEWREEKIEELKKMLLAEMQQTTKFLELLELLIKQVNEDPHVKSFCVMFEKDRVTELWSAKYLYKSHFYDIKDLMMGKHHLKVTKMDGTTEYIEVNLPEKPSKGLP